jgi:hypothetical protein
MIKESGAVSGMRICKENWSTRRKLALLTLCPHKIQPHLISDRTWAAMAERQRLTSLAVA